MGRVQVVLTPARWVLLKRGVSAADVARELGLSYGRLASAVSGKYPAAPDIVEALTDYLGVTVEELFPPDGAS